MGKITSENIETGSCTIHCLKGTKAKGRDILLLHGAKFQAATWEKITTLENLDNGGFRVHAMDLPGYGKSPKCAVEPETVIQEFIDSQELTRPVLVGPSMSGWISLNFVLKYPEMVGGLVLIGAVGVHDMIGQLGAIEVPCLILWGSNDTVSPLGNAHLLHKKISGSELRIFDDAGHPCYLDRTDLWHEVLFAFLRKHFL